ncbi:DUF2635 domain-containing protein [Erwinia tracheiphila]|uniref:DUF2635 domain-containing protein n=1 Tax=Erwinia tracheiphila TaxID=65700 RepID=A0A0M2KFE3_9GAMM|nr:DUF2635 domain-containing protein [Erwinia tracheiphila]EOS93082.1 hypothetical protein ETR_20907 [Erwinia tracheiphila PSU-1]KKF37649.1 hypothetical protein SY86_23235 [Erwinia tracheiphila]UIA89045.1 DUF2635 domain-containing protein [Erwinia tracheiphila]UIA97428.1 DUF2635 domain-containing protein [Erwinia tracheiphila]
MIKVIARKGIQVPVEGRSDRYITDKEAVEVPETAYWLRRLRDGDLLLYAGQAKSAAAEAADVKPSGKNAEISAAPAAKADK